MVHLYSAFNQGFTKIVHYIHPFTLTFITFTHSHTHIHTQMAEETMQGTNLLTGSNKGFRVLLKDSSTLTLGEPRIELGTLREHSVF